jgi:hypothetical protein
VGEVEPVGGGGGVVVVGVVEGAAGQKIVSTVAAGMPGLVSEWLHERWRWLPRPWPASPL